MYSYRLKPVPGNLFYDPPPTAVADLWVMKLQANGSPPENLAKANL